jgi:hypothetical protein
VMAFTWMKSKVIFGPNRLIANYVPKALYLEGLYYIGQVLKFSIHRWIFKCQNVDEWEMDGILICT